MIKKYVKKPIEIEAVQWIGNNLEEIYEFVGVENLCFNSKAVGEEVGELYIRTIEGDMHAAVNDFIIKGVKGEFYPCKPDIFYETYVERSEIKMCANEEMAIDILEFIKRNYEKHLNEDGQAGCQKYIEALQMGIDALRKGENNIC